MPSPEPVPTSPPPTPTPTEPDGSATPTPGDSTVPAECALGDPTARQPHPADGRIHGGGLSFPMTAGFTPTEQQSSFSWAYDVGGQDRAVEEKWNSTYVVGALPTFEGFESPKQAAELVLTCTVASELYRGFSGRTDVSSSSIVIDKRRGWPSSPKCGSMTRPSVSPATPSWSSWSTPAHRNHWPCSGPASRSATTRHSSSWRPSPGNSRSNRRWRHHALRQAQGAVAGRIRARGQELRARRRNRVLSLSKDR